MLNGNVRPKSLIGIKRLATELRTKVGTKHAEALDTAAKFAGYENYREARKDLLTAHQIGCGSSVLLTRYWIDENDGHRRGRETLKIELSRDILDICSKKDLKYVRGFRDLRMVADDHFVSDTLAPSQKNAREQLCTAERSLRFMEYTSLQPDREFRKRRNNYKIAKTLPNIDHPSYWLDPKTGQSILVDEPYQRAFNETSRSEWAKQNKCEVFKSSWPGMYNPYSCSIFLIFFDQQKYISKIFIEKVNKIPAPLIAENWEGESSNSWTTFLSPLATTAQDARRARCRGTIFPKSSSNTEPYNFNLGSYHRRPIGQLGIEGHIEAGREIKAILDCDVPSGVFRRLNIIRSTLEEWMLAELSSREKKSDKVLDIYYGKHENDKFQSIDSYSASLIINKLCEIKNSMIVSYKPSAPLRKLVNSIDTSISILKKI
ncbi:MAG: DUF5623 domain-containing protein [Nitratireductor sp.]|nr:DUF5623 domain-containing protein [Nitratireductor sp.]